MSETNDRKGSMKKPLFDPAATIAPEIKIRLLAAFGAIADHELRARILEFLESLSKRQH